MGGKGMRTRFSALFVRAKRWSGGFSRFRTDERSAHGRHGISRRNPGLAVSDLWPSVIPICNSHPCQSVKVRAPAQVPKVARTFLSARLRAGYTRARWQTGMSAPHSACFAIYLSSYESEAHARLSVLRISHVRRWGKKWLRL